MTPTRIRAEVVVERSALVRSMLDEIRRLPLEDLEEFLGDRRNPASAESFLRRALETLLDLGRHIAARGFGHAAVEYKEIPRALADQGVIDQSTCDLYLRMAGYRNRMVHFYHEITEQELFEICSHQLDDVERVLDALLAWLRANPDRLEGILD